MTPEKNKNNPSENQVIDVLIVEDHPIVVEGLQKMLQNSSFIRVVGTAGSGKACLDFLRWEKADIILLDINLPDINGIDLCHQIISKNPSQKILTLSTFGGRHHIKSMLENGAKGYVLKNSPPEEILEGILAVYKGKIYFCHGAEKKTKQTVPQGMELTRREIEVLKCIADGLTNVEIAEKLFISPLTVDSHRKNLITKLQVKNTAMLIKVAAERGFL